MTGRTTGSTEDQGLLAAYEAVICDLDGVVHRGHRAVAGASEALDQVLASGKRIVYATNNASRPPGDVVSHLMRLGAPATAADVVTSAQAGAVRVRELVPPGSAVVALGGAGVVAALAEQDLDPVAPDAEEAVAVLQGYGPTLTVADFTAVTRHLLRGVPWVATNGDLTLPVEWGTAPGNGAYVELVSRAVGRGPDGVTGKPAAPLYDLAIDRLDLPRGAVVAVGDRLDTDIDGATAAGIDSAWVLTGVHQPSDLLAGARPGPTYVLDSLRGLHEPYAAPRPTENGWVCAAYGAVVRSDVEGSVRLQIARVDGAPVAPDHRGGHTWPIEAVRAGLAALLEARGAGRASIAELSKAAEALDRPAA